MMKRICLVATGLAIVLCTARCAKEKGIVANEDGLSYVTLTASKGTLTKTSLAQDSNNDLIVSWTEGDKLYAVAETDGFLGALTLEGSGGSESGTFAGNIKYVSAKQTVRFYYVGKNKSITDNSYTLDLSSQLGTLDDIVNNLHLMSGSISNVTPAMVNLGAVTMSNVISIVKVDTKTAFGEVSGISLSGCVNNGVVNLKTGAVTPASGDISLTGTASNECYIALLANGASQSLNFSNNGEIASLDAKTIVQGKFYSDNGNSIALHSFTCLPGSFSVSPTKMVQFSKGNLQATYHSSTSGYTWAFAANQYDFIGNAPGNTTLNSQTNGSVVDLFGWVGASSTVLTGDHTKYGITTSLTNTDYGSVSDESLKNDWGTAIDNLGTWKTMSKDDWLYLLGASTPGRSTDLRKCGVTVCGKVGCLVIAPDDWDLSAHPLQTEYSSVSTPMTWEQAEAAGLVCLPHIGGYRWGTSFDPGASHYWTSTANGSTNAYDLKFYSSSLVLSDDASRPNGFSVRLVKYKSDDPVILPGVFSVSSTRKVQFSGGNLRYKVSLDKWCFFKHQYDCGPSTYAAGHDTEISLFTWGYGSGWSKTPGTTSYLSGHTTDGESFSYSEDWGSLISPSGSWGTLTMGEWQYLLESRTNAAQKVGYATVAGVNGIILLPDKFTDPKTNTAAGAADGGFVPKSTSGFTANVYTSGANWEAMESAGAVFLPAAGVRYGTTLYDVGTSVGCWSSTSKNESAAYLISGIEGTILSNATNNRKIACSVRLVTDASGMEVNSMDILDFSW